MKKTWENHPENPDEKTVQTLEAPAENERNHFSETSRLPTNMPQKKGQQANNTTKRHGAEVGLPSGKAWKNHPENPNEKTEKYLIPSKRPKLNGLKKANTRWDAGTSTTAGGGAAAATK